MFSGKCIASLFFLYFILISSILGFDQCTPHPPCICEFDDGRIVDLNPLAKGDFIEGSQGSVHYYFHPCANKNLILPNVTNNCASGTSLCMYDSTANTTTNIGKADDGILSPARTGRSDETNYFDITFTDKKINKTTSVTLICSPFGETIFHVDTKSKLHNLLLLTKYACPYMQAHGLSTGSVLVIIFLVFSTVYLLGGACILHFLRGARGKEIIPNIDFWSDLPLLVRDGVVFLQNGCKPPQQPGETYDRI